MSNNMIPDPIELLSFLGHGVRVSMYISMFYQWNEKQKLIEPKTSIRKTRMKGDYNEILYLWRANYYFHIRFFSTSRQVPWPPIHSFLRETVVVVVFLRFPFVLPLDFFRKSLSPSHHPLPPKDRHAILTFNCHRKNDYDLASPPLPPRAATDSVCILYFIIYNFLFPVSIKTK